MGGHNTFFQVLMKKGQHSIFLMYSHVYDSNVFFFSNFKKCGEYAFLGGGVDQIIDTLHIAFKEQTTNIILLILLMIITLLQFS